MKRVIKKAISLFLAIILTVAAFPVAMYVAPIEASASSATYQKEYYYASGSSFVYDLAIARRPGGYVWNDDECKDDLSGGGYTAINKDLNKDAGGQYIFAGYKTNTTESTAIRAIAFFNGSNPPDTYQYAINGITCTFNLVKKAYVDSSSQSTSAVDLNQGAGGDYIYMYYSTDPNAGPPITYIDTSSNSSESSRYAAGVWMNTYGNGAKGSPADLNSGTGADSIYMHWNATGTEVDTDSLHSAITNAENNYLANSSRYTSDTIAALQSAVDSAKPIVNDYNADGLSCNYDQTAIDNATNAINNAINGLCTTLYFDGNGGTATFSSIIVPIGSASEWSYSGDISAYNATRTGYTFLGWSTDKNATTPEFAVNGNYVKVGFNTTLYAVWDANEYNITFDNLIDFPAWNKTAGYGTVSNVTDTGFTITSNDGAGEATSTSPLFPVTAGKQYKVDIDFDGDNWDVYIFFYGEGTTSGTGLEFQDGTNRFSSNGGGNSSRIFTAPEGAVNAVIRLDANGSGNTVSFDNIRVYEENGVTYSGDANKIVSYDSAYPATSASASKTGYDLLGWFDSNGTKYYNADGSTVITSVFNHTSDLDLYSRWTVNDNSLTEDIVVLDFGLPVTTVSPFDNDEIFMSQATSSTSNGYKLLGFSTDGTSTPVETLSGIYGTFSFNGTTVTYTPTAVMNGIDRVYYHASVSDSVTGVTEVKCEICIVPATVVYYEDNYSSMVTYKNGVSADNSTGAWTTDGESKLASATQSVADDVYGYDDIYANSADKYSMGSAHFVSVSKYNNPNSKYSGSEGNSWPVAEFTFAGTGFDIVSLISKETGAIEVKVLDADGNKVYDWIVDTYYGYELDANGDWVVSTSDSALYQIPVIGRTDLAYGTYTVQIIPTYTTRLDHQKDGAYDFYLDAIRVYNPCGDDLDASSAYAADGQYVISHTAVRDILINAKDLDATSNSTGVVYINSKVTEGTFDEYSKSGPKNEVYLANGQAVAFNMTVDMIPDSVQVGLHAVTENAAGVRFANGTGSYTKEYSVASMTTLYYTVDSSSFNWTANSDGSYSTSTPVVITSTGSGVLSVCNIRCTSSGVAAASVMFMMNEDDLYLASAAAYTVSALSVEDDGHFESTGETTVETDAEDVVTAGSDVVVTLTTAADVARVTVNGEDATLVSENDDGTLTWTYIYTTSAVSGTETLTFVSYNSDGYASEETTVTVEVKTAVEIFFNDLKEFFSVLIEFIKKVVDTLTV